MDYKLLNGANLAFVGDAYYELVIREHLINKKITNLHKLHDLSVKYVSATAHNLIMEKLLPLLNEEEIDIFHRGRNYSYSSRRKNVKRDEYINSSGFEALIGYLYLIDNKKRLEEIINLAINIVEDYNE
ncbi:MAG: ribonuclease III domain-containing protein [Bacilli bacterium]|jgi:ribonuclease-3 family protein|nr:ribonuclease III domain-containing protein [Bacilli bacterium]MDD2681704.1 ribonuclease III domain-containing protein [Bacilli bacterium]MDD3121545.1 ribonuclease III domain-containing protein [Bacilli bacterium]MDD4062816.1 ribonuclease III domain-containing protein [Bacilli bacterium]MDD4482229.1 ribonuclease III domain-containing protein [Bacilli bacterium]